MSIPTNKKRATINDVAPAANSFTKAKSLVNPNKDVVEIAIGIDGLRAFLEQHLSPDALEDFDAKLAVMKAALARERDAAIDAERRVRDREAAAKGRTISAEIQRLIQSIL